VKSLIAVKTLFPTPALLAPLCLGATVALISAQTNPPPERLPNVVVEGLSLTNAAPLTVPTVEQAKDALRLVPGGASIVTAEEFKIGRASTLKDVLEYAPGVFVQPRFGAEEARLSIRGSGLQRTFHGRGIKLLQDGVPLNLADGGFDFQAVEPLATRYVEVYRGANALRYGSATLGGAINYVSLTGYDADRVQLRLEGGSFDYQRAQVSSGAVSGNADYYATFTSFTQDGFRDHSRQENQRIFANMGVRLDDNVENRTWITLVDTFSELPGNLTKAQLEANPQQANPAQVNGDQQRNFELFRLANKTTWQGDGRMAEIGVFWSYKDLDHPIFQVLDVVSSDVGADARYRMEGELFGNQNTLLVGFYPVYGRAHDTRFQNIGGDRGALLAESIQESLNLDLYAENQNRLSEKLALVLGLQLSYADRDYTDLFLGDGDISDRQDYFGVNPKIGLLYNLDERTQLFANFSRSFEPPSFGELVPLGSGLRDLDEQTAWTIEIGTRGERGRFAWDVAWYYSWVSDELLGFEFPAGSGSSATTNANDTIHMGVEVGLDIRLLENLLAREEDGRQGDQIVLRNAYLWNWFHFDGDATFGDNQLPGVPEHFLRSELRYEHRCGFYAGPNVEWSPSDYPVDMANTLFADSYALLGFRLGWRSKHWNVFFDARNLTDERYAATTGVITRYNSASVARQ
jgi:iron complex outermembrane receptor protein